MNTKEYQKRNMSEENLQAIVFEFMAKVMDMTQNMGVSQNQEIGITDSLDSLEKEEVTLRKIFPLWLRHKMIERKDSSTTIQRIMVDWEKYYEKDSFITDTPVCKLTVPDLEDWANNLISEGKLTKKAYYNLTIIVRQSFCYAVKKKMILWNPFAGVEVNNKLFYSKRRKPAEEQVYNADEYKELRIYLKNKVYHEEFYALPAAIFLQIVTGCRIGEILGLQWSDISENVLSIQRQIVANYVMIDGRMVKRGWRVKEHPKSDAGFRDLYLTKEACEILEYIKDQNLKTNNKDHDFIFVKNSSRVTYGQYRKYLTKCCMALDIKYRPTHSIRKSTLSVLVDNDIDIQEVSRIAGHSEIKTTLEAYIFSTSSKEKTNQKLEKLLSAG